MKVAPTSRDSDLLDSCIFLSHGRSSTKQGSHIICHEVCMVHAEQSGNGNFLLHSQIIIPNLFSKYRHVQMLRRTPYTTRNSRLIFFSVSDCVVGPGPRVGMTVQVRELISTRGSLKHSIQSSSIPNIHRQRNPPCVTLLAQQP